VVKEASQQATQDLALLGREWGEELVLGHVEDTVHSPQVLRAGSRQPHDVAATVLGIGHPLDEALLGQLVDGGYHVAAIQMAPPGEVGLAGGRASR
jgi:hypothetical protein